MELYDLLSMLCQAYGPSGDEGEIREVISNWARPYADEIFTDALGNLIVHKQGSGPKFLFAAHMDSIGFMVTHITEDGFLRCGRLGGISPKETVFSPVRFKNGVQGVFVKEEKADFGKLRLDECFLDIGAKSREEASAMVQVGDTAIYDSAVRCNRRKVISPYLDNRVSCAVLLMALKELGECPNDLYFVFTVQEEVGLRGAKTAAYGLTPDWSFVVDVTDPDDTPGSEKTGTVQLGKGAGIKIMDHSVICHPEAVRQLELVAKIAAIPVQREIMQDGGTDAGAIHASRMGVCTGGISIPCRYVHTPVEMVDLDDVDACIKLVVACSKTVYPNNSEQ